MKKRRILITGGALLLSAFAACEPYLSLDEALKDRACADAEPRCAPGYECSAEGTCEKGLETGTSPVLPPGLPGMRGDAGTSTEASPVGAAGAGSEPAQGSAGSSGNEPTPVGGTGGALGSAGAGSMSVDTGGSGGDPAEPTPGVADAGCVTQVLFRDRDGDGFGSDAPEDEIVDCPQDGFVTKGGDCNDAETDVSPDQALFFTVGYQTANGVSFDYDCSKNEEADPSGPFVPAPTNCEERQVCGADPGYVAPADPRSGMGVNPLCGTRERALCFANQPPVCSLTAIPAGAPFPCR